GVLLAVPVAGSADDAEEVAAAVASPPQPAGAVATTGPSLELPADPALGVAQHVGLRFQGVPVPPGASLVDARVVFTAAAAGDGARAPPRRARAAGRRRPRRPRSPAARARRGGGGRVRAGGGAGPRAGPPPPPPPARRRAACAAPAPGESPAAEAHVAP